MRRAAYGLVALTFLAACGGGDDEPPESKPATPLPESSAPAPATTPAPAATTTAPAKPAVPAGGPVPAGFYPVAFSFVSSTTGFVLGSAETCAKKPCTSVLRTTDAGRTWKGIPAPVADTEEGGQGVSSLSFADERNGFAWGDALWSTHDGGATWKQVRLAGDVQSLAIGGDRAYAVVDPCDAGSDTCTTPPVLFSGAASGDALTPSTGVRFPEGIEDAQVVTHGSSVFVTANTNSDAPADLRLYSSADGKAFTARTVPCNDDALGFDVAASGDRNLAGICNEDGAAGMQGHQVFVSSDAGQRWTRVGDPPQLGGSGLVATGKGTFFANRNGVSVTRDGGKTWPTSFEDTGGGADDVGFVSDDLGFLTDQRKLFVTRDAGRSWQPVAF